jgi:hypothetical protein
MAGEYYRWQARNEKPPEEAAPLTGRKKTANWLYYHRIHLIAGGAAIFILLEILLGTLGVGKTFPDYQIAYAGTRYLPEETVKNLEEALARYGEDCNGDGKVIVQINQYVRDRGESGTAAPDASYNAASEAAMLADMEGCESYFFLLEEPGRFQKDYQILALADGSLPSEGETREPLAVAWTDAPLLRDMDLGTYEETVGTERISGKGSDILSPLYLARRGFWGEKTCDHQEACSVLWQVLTEGAR